MKKKSPEFLVKALIISLILIVVDLIGGFAHLRFDSWFRWLSSIILAIALIIVCIQYGKLKEDGVTFGNAFGYGFKITAIIAALMFVYTILSIFLIFPEIQDQVLEKTRADMEAKGGYSEDTIDQGVAMTKKLFIPLALVGSVVGTLIVGTIGSLLGAAFTKKSEPVPTIFKDNP